VKSGPSLAAETIRITAGLKERGIPSRRIGLLAALKMSSFPGDILVLRYGSPHPVLALHYLLQIEGELSRDLLGILARDPRTGAFRFRLDDALEERLRTELHKRLLSRAA
jgi:hypothetical protein